MFFAFIMCITGSGNRNSIAKNHTDSKLRHLSRLVCLATGYTVTVCREDDGVIYGQSIRCNEDRHVINIISATVGYSEHDDRRPTSDSDECTVNDHVRCRRRTNSPEIMECNGHPNCSLGLDAFNFPGTSGCGGRQRGNVINITYKCISGTRTYFITP